jgi:predicted membrane-bound spermidine synthase
MKASVNLSSPIATQLDSSTRLVHLTLYALFFCSGCSALIYQVMWQRMLFTAFGVDMTSVTIIVSVFMFGLGLGGVIGGQIADAMPNRLLMLYIIIELLIVAFGLASPHLINSQGGALFTNSLIMTGIISYFILAIPTLLMGATFPVLVTHVNKITRNIGESVGGLYFANTLGGAMGAFMSGFVLLHTLDLTGAIKTAAMINLAVAFCAFAMFRPER